MVFHSAPLAYIDKSNSRHRMHLLDFEREKHALEESLEDAETIGSTIDVVFETATIDRVNAFFAQRPSRVLHLSCHGNEQYLALEDGRGGTHFLMASDLKRLVSVGGGNLKVVFVSACHSKEAGQAFIDSGVPHVICSRTDALQDLAAVEFSKNFYRALACRICLKEAFLMAKEAVRVSADVSNGRLEADKFLLLPETSPDDPYHDVQVFYQDSVPAYSGGSTFSKDQLSRVPRLPELFVGRELVIFDILELLNDADVIQLDGEEGCGRSTAAVAVARYMLSRPKSFPNDFFGWFPRRNDLPSMQDRLYDDLNVTLKLAAGGRLDEEIWRRLVSALSGLRITIVLDLRKFDTVNYESLGHLIRDLLNICSRAKIIAITPHGENDSKSSFNVSSKRVARLSIPKLDFESTALLFGWVTPFVTQRARNPVLLNPRTFADDLLDIEDEEAKFELYCSMGMGNPARILEAASTISEAAFLELIK
mmetsp:Transcript_29927/g.56157  ORF Transcript_29927/g.56157 Transcript_29927/m.56157 type:complete len:480 (+) Transcript_29927:159-1598(+)